MIFRRALSRLRTLRSEHGGSMMEFAFVAPIILIISGATIDIGRFIRINQITSVMSQNTANIIYRRCIDRTEYKYETSLGTTGVKVIETTTKDKITTCMTDEVNKAQALLNGVGGNGILPGAFIMATGYRFNVTKTDRGRCSPFPAPMPVQITPSPANITVARGYLNKGTIPADFVKPQATLTSAGLSLNGRSLGSSTALNACTKNRVVVVEVTYPFTPIVSFLPNFLPGFNLNSDGVFRETTVL